MFESTLTSRKKTGKRFYFCDLFLIVQPQMAAIVCFFQYQNVCDLVGSVENPVAVKKLFMVRLHPRGRDESTWQLCLLLAGVCLVPTASCSPISVHFSNTGVWTSHKSLQHCTILVTFFWLLLWGPASLVTGVS